jgi:hypothetical protein
MLHSSETKLGQSRRVRRLAMALILATVGLAACGGGDGNETGAGTTPGVDSDLTADPGEGSEEIVIKTRVVFPKDEPPAGATTATGEVLDGSTIGDSPFCPGGTFRDQHGNPDPSVPPFGLVDRTFSCSDGTLRIGFTPGEPQGQTQAGPWKVVSGTGAFEGLQGDGEIEIKPGTGNEGRETFTGTVTH